MSVLDHLKQERIKMALKETEVHLYTNSTMDNSKNISIDRRKSEGMSLSSYLDENYIAGFSDKPMKGERETRALSQEIETPDQNMASSDQMDYEEEVGSMDADEGEPDIVLIEEDYKSMLEDSKNNDHLISRKDFKFIKLIGSGAHAKVYLARKYDDNTLFAVKVLNKKELNQKKQITGTKVERKILVSFWSFIKNYRKRSTLPLS